MQIPVLLLAALLLAFIAVGLAPGSLPALRRRRLRWRLAGMSLGGDAFRPPPETGAARVVPAAHPVAVGDDLGMLNDPPAECAVPAAGAAGPAPVTAADVIERVRLIREQMRRAA